jgi:hypothetical protein
LDAHAGNLAIAMTKQQVTERQTVARVALDAPCRPDLIDSVAMTSSGAGPAGWRIGRRLRRR